MGGERRGTFSNWPTVTIRSHRRTGTGLFRPLVAYFDFVSGLFRIRLERMTMTFTHAAAVVAGLAIFACYLMIGRKGLLSSLAAAVAFGIVAALIIRAVA